MQIVQFPHPALRHPSKALRRVDRSIKELIREMFDLMYAANGIGLAANQVDRPFRLFVINLASDPEAGEELVFINPVLSRYKGSEEGEEGCLSLPGLYGKVTRPKQVHVQAYDLQGNQIDADLTGMLSRVVQHENDHLDGKMFTDRMSELGRLSVAPVLDEFRLDYRSRQRSGAIEDDETIRRKLVEREKDYC